MSAFCHFDQFAPGFSDCDYACSQHCRLWLRGDGECDEECDSVQCGWDFGDCRECDLGCRESQVGNGVCEQACNTVHCGFDAGDCEPFHTQRRALDCPEEIWVSALGTSGGSGTLEDPYDSLSLAMAKACNDHTSIYLLDGVHYLQRVDETLSSIDFIINTRSPLNHNSLPLHLMIETFLCSNPPLPHCTETPATVYLSDFSVQLAISTAVTFRNLRIDGRKSLVADCTAEMCFYCPALTSVNETHSLTDKNQLVRNDQVALSALCQVYSETALFVVNSTGVLTLDNVNITDVRYEPLAIVLMKAQAVVDLLDVHFSNIIVRKNKGALVLSTPECDQSPCSKGAFSFIGGSVKTLNNGFEYNANLQLGGFCLFDGVETVKIQAVTFERNVWTGSTEMGMMEFKQIGTLEITDCTFQYCLAVNLIVVVLENVVIDSHDIDENQVADDTEKILVSMQSSKFQQNRIEQFLLLISLSNDYLNIAIQDCVFHQNFSVSESLILIVFDEEVTAAMIEGRWDSGVYYAPRYFSLTDSIFRSNAASSILSVYKIPNVNIASCTLIESNDPEQDSETIVRAAFSSDESVYLSQPLPSAIKPCAMLILSELCGNLALKSFTISGNYCEQGPSGLKATGVKRNVDIEEGTFEGNLSVGEMGTVVYLEKVGIVTLVTARFVNNLNINKSSEGLVYIKSVYSIAIESSVFSGNSIFAGSGLSINSPTLFVISQSIFEKNSAVDGSVGVVNFAMGPETVLFLAVDVRFVENYSSLGSGAIMISSSAYGTPLNLNMTNVHFERNHAYYASVMYVASFALLTEDSEIRRCTFSENTSGKGNIWLEFDEGILTFSDCEFHSNAALTASVLFQTGATVRLLNCLIDNSTSDQSTLLISSEDTLKYLITTNCTFRNNSRASLQAQYTYWQDSGSRFLGNRESAVAFTKNSVLTLAGTLFQDNWDDSTGGAGFFTLETSVTCKSCTFRRNSSGYAAGAFFIQNDSIVNITDSLFDSNTAIGYGSALVFLATSSVLSSLTNTTFINNEISSAGTIALFLASATMSSVRFLSNRCNGTTPGVFLIASRLQVDSSFFFNQSGGLGSAFSASSLSSLRIVNSEFVLGRSTEGGMAHLSDTSMEMRNSLVVNFSAVSGGVFTALSNCDVAIHNVTARDVSATEGAVIVMTGSTFLAITNSKFERFASGGVICERVARVTVSDTVFSSGNGTSGGALTCTRCKDISIERSVFQGNNATIGGAVFLISQESDPLTTVVLIKHSTFLNNSAQHGGAVYTNDLSVQFQNSTFMGNTADKINEKGQNFGFGGAVSVYCSTQSRCLFGFFECRFEKNRADVSGGAIEWTDIRPNVTNCSFAANAAEYGADISSFPVAIKQVSASRRLVDTAVLPNCASGQSTKQSLVIALIDHYGNIVATDNGSEAEIQAIDVKSTTLSGVTKTIAVRGVFTFDQFIIIADPGTVAQVKVATAAVDKGKQERADDGVQYASNIEFQAEMRLCELGESHVGKSCEICPPEKYSLDPNSTACATCPSEAICLGNFTVIPKKGYWRASKLTATFYKCLFSSACVGSPEDPLNLTYTGLCADGYMGRLCETCSLGFSRTGKYECSKCPERSANIMRLVFISIGIGVVAGVMVSTTLKSAHREKSLSSIYIKILMNYLQIVMLTASFNLSWPKLVLKLLSVQESAGSMTEQAFSFDCYLQPEKGSSTNSVVYNKLIVMAVIPILIAAASGVSWLLISGYKHTTKLPKNELIATMVILLFLAHPNLTKSFFSMFTCMTIERRQYLLQQLEIQCWSKEHLFYSCVCALPAILVWIIGIPAICLGYLINNKRKLANVEHKIRLGFLFNGYRKKAYYWEFIILYRKIVIICCSVFLTTVSIPIQALLVIFILVLSLYLQDAVQPYTTPELNRMELKSITCAAITIYCGLFFLTGDLGEEAKLVLFASIVTVNALFIWYWIQKMFGFYIFLAINKVPCLSRKLGKIKKVKDGLDDDLLVDPVTCSTSPFSALKPKPLQITSDEAASLQSMDDLYYLKVRFCNSGGSSSGAKEADLRLEGETFGCPNSPKSDYELEVDNTDNSLIVNESIIS